MKKLLTILLTLALLTAVGLVGYVALMFIFAHFATLTPQATTITLAILFTALIISFIIAGAIRGSRKQEGLYRQQAERAAIYGDFLRVWRGLLQDERRRNMPQQAQQTLARVNNFLILQGSSSVLKEYTVLQKQLQQETGTESTGLVSQLERVLLEMRKDLGQHNWGLNTADLLELLRYPVNENPRYETAENSFQQPAQEAEV